MGTTITLASTCSKARVRRRSNRRFVGCGALRRGRSKLSSPIPTGSALRPRPDPRRLLLAPGIQRVVHRGLEVDLQVVALAMDHCEPMGDRLESGCLRGPGDVFTDIRSVHDLREAVQSRVVEPVLEEDRLKAAAAVHVAELNAADVIWDGPGLLGGGDHLRRPDV